MPAESGHGVVIHVTLDPSGSPTVFTPIDELVGDITFKTSHASKKVTPHSRGGVAVVVDEYVVSNEVVRDEMALSLNYDSTNADHDTLIDLADSGTFIGFGKVGPGGTLHGVGSIMMSGELVSSELTDPQFEGERRVNFMFRPSGPYRRNGVLYS